MRHEGVARITHARGRKSLFSQYDEALAQLSAEDLRALFDQVREYLEEQGEDTVAAELLEDVNL